MLFDLVASAFVFQTDRTLYKTANAEKRGCEIVDLYAGGVTLGQLTWP